MQIEQLELYKTVVESGGMTAAAGALGMSQPAVSRSMRALERQLGVALFRRDGRGIQPTEAGQLAYERAVELTNDWRNLVAELRVLAGRPNEVTIAVPFGTARVLIPVLVRRATTDVADIAVRIIESASPKSQAMVDSGEVDAAIVYPEPEDRDGEGLEHLVSEKLYAMGQPDTFGGVGVVGEDEKPIHLAELVDVPLLLTGPSWSIRRTIDEAFVGIDATPQVAREVGIADALLAFAMEGEGVAILPFSNVVRDHQLGSLAVREISNPAIERNISMKLGTGLATVVAEELREVLRSSIEEVAPAARWFTV